MMSSNVITKTVLVRVGEREEEVGRSLAPLVKELWKAEIYPTKFGRDNPPEFGRDDEIDYTVLEFDQEEYFLSFYDIVTLRDEDDYGLYDRMITDSTVGVYPAWNFTLFLEDLSNYAGENSQSENTEVPQVHHAISLTYSLDLPTWDVPVVVERLKNHNELQQWAKARLEKPAQLPTLKLYGLNTDGPPLQMCALCSARYKDWCVPGDDWKLIPEKFASLKLCEQDFLRLVKEAGHDPDSIQIGYEPWQKQTDAWEHVKDYPEHHWKILVECADGSGGDETMWCEVLCRLEEGMFAVRLLNSSIFQPWYQEGKLYKAKWDGETIQLGTGRPVLKPVCPLREIPTY